MKLKILLLLALFCLPAFAQESCTISSDGTTLSVSDCSPALDAAPFSAQVSFTPAYSYADNRYCGKGNVAKFGTNDGPATLPQACFYTALDGTASPGALTKVGAGSLQTALNAAQCGDTLLLDHTQTFSGPYNFPAKNCDDAHWITVRTDSPDSALPYEGKRIDPSSSSVLAKIAMRPNSSPNTFGDHYRFIGIEWKKLPGGILNAFANMSGSSKIVFDRNYFHGNPGEELAHGVQENGATYIAVLDSYLVDFHCIAGTGSCTDAQAISGGNSTLPMGPFKAVNNYLEAAGENILYGGGPSTQVPCDIEIRHNTLNKPRAWNPLEPSYVGIAYIVKNHFELKNGCRVLFEGNTLRNTWGGYSQIGASILLTAKNQANYVTHAGECPSCEVHDVTVRYNKVSRVGTVYQIGFVANDLGDFAKAEYNVSVHDLLADDLAYANCYKCGGAANQLFEAANLPVGTPALTGVAIDRVTESFSGPLNSMLSMGGGTASSPMANISLTNSIFLAGKYGPWNFDGTASCAYNQLSPLAKFNACWKPYSFTGNVVIGGLAIQQGKQWPEGNFFPVDSSTLSQYSAGANQALVLQYTQ